jgi:glyoxylase-like metal-dependent hydrolase (beta-lactamase superfamily II)/rhodanese-related sulfurtransferase
MIFRRFACEPLAQSAYVLADGDEALVVDPLRDADDVLAFLTEHRLRATWVVATHVHADFVAGLEEVAAATGAQIGIGEAFAGRMRVQRLAHGQRLRFGDQVVEILATPGHTFESVCLHAVGRETPGRLLTGDTLFVGDVGRPDLAEGTGQGARAMADLLFASLRERILPLPPDTEVWPAHGAGSACGSCIAAAASSTLAAERADNWALRGDDAMAFQQRLLATLRPPPAYFGRVAARNRDGTGGVAPTTPVRELDVAATQRLVHDGARLLDVRSWAAHGAGHWPTAVNIGLDGGEFEPWAGALLPAQRPIVVHAENATRAQQAARRLRRVGLDDVAGFVVALPATPDRVPQIEAVDLFAPDGASAWQVLDVRRPAEFAEGHVPGSVLVELGTTPNCTGLDRARATAVLCEGGYRSSAALAALRAVGFTNLHNVRDGMRGWRGNHLPLGRGGATATS